jgi:uncharacterized membrane protein
MITRPGTFSWRSFSGLGVFLGALFFAASLTPSLIPRPAPIQGVLAGTAFAAGYGIGVVILWLWQYLELPLAENRIRRAMTWVAALIAVGIVVPSSWHAAAWQNTIRARMDMPTVDTAHPFQLGFIAFGVALALILIGRLFIGTLRLAARKLERVAPTRLARFLGLVIALTLFALVIDGVLFRGFLMVADRGFQARDALMRPDTAPPAGPTRTGGPNSLVGWDDLGSAGRDFVSNGPTGAEIAAFTGRPALDPIRVFVGLNAAETPEERADLALRELIRVGAFDRSVLVIAVPTGTGWMDPAAFDTLDYLTGGDVATVAVQYSYLTSWISLLVEPGYGQETGRALFRAVYHHWTDLPPDARPKVYLQGLSLGSISSEQSVGIHEMLADPIQGAVWSGPPFASPTWRAITDNRDPGSPAWLPVFEDGTLVRFTNQENALDMPGVPWGPMRIVYLQYASDPIVFFEPDSVWREPAWMKAPRGPDVSPSLRWVPVVTFLQLLLDMALGLAVPMGHGHLYHFSHYIDAWQAVIDPPGWSPESTADLKAFFAPRAVSAEGE